MAQDLKDLLDPAEIEALLSPRRGEHPPAEPPEILPNPVAAAAVSNSSATWQHDLSPFAPEPQPFTFEVFDPDPDTASPAANALEVETEPEIDVQIELGRTEITVAELQKLRDGSVVTLDKLAGDPVDIVVEGRVVARGEVLVLNDKFCIRVAEILAPPHI